jgi:hypothetical protein
VEDRFGKPYLEPANGFEPLTCALRVREWPRQPLFSGLPPQAANEQLMISGLRRAPLARILGVPSGILGEIKDMPPGRGKTLEGLTIGFAVRFSAPRFGSLTALMKRRYTYIIGSKEGSRPLPRTLR